MTRILVPAVASCMLVAYAGLASAQAPDRREGPGGGGRDGAAQHQQREAPRAVQQERQRVQQEQPRAERPAARPQVDRGDARARQAAPDQRARDRDVVRDRANRQQQSDQQRNADRDRNAERRRASDREQGRAAERAEQRRNLERQRDAERARQTERNRTVERNRVEDRAPADRARTDARPADRRRVAPRSDARVAVRGEEFRRARERLAPDQRQRLRASFDFRRARASNTRVQARIAYRVPRSVRLYPVPSQVVSFFPDYRDYRYFVVGGQVCIVDPGTYEIVDVIDQGYYAYAPSQSIAAVLSLTPQQVALVRDSIPRDFPDAEDEVRLTTGAAIPASVELFTFPESVLDRIPKLRDYRFLVIGEHLIIADNADRTVELVLDRI